MNFLKNEKKFNNTIISNLMTLAYFFRLFNKVVWKQNEKITSNISVNKFITELAYGTANKRR